MSTVSVTRTKARRSSYSTAGLNFESHPVEIVGDDVRFPSLRHILEIDCEKESRQECQCTGLAKRSSGLLFQAIVDEIVLLPYSWFGIGFRTDDCCIQLDSPHSKSSTTLFSMGIVRMGAGSRHDWDLGKSCHDRHLQSAALSSLTGNWAWMRPFKLLDLRSPQRCCGMDFALRFADALLFVEVNPSTPSYLCQQPRQGP